MFYALNVYGRVSQKCFYSFFLSVIVIRCPVAYPIKVHCYIQYCGFCIHVISKVFLLFRRIFPLLPSIIYPERDYPDWDED